MIVKNDRSGFTLIELSIVIIIIALILAGVSTGSSLYKQSQIRSVISEFNQHKQSYLTFLSTYKYPPGDFPRASLYWSTCASTNTWCNGNGNRKIEPTTTTETRYAWRHLYLAGLTNANISQPAATVESIIVGTRAPASAISGAGYVMSSGYYSAPYYLFRIGGSYANGGHLHPWGGAHINAIFLGKQSPLAGGDDSGVLSAGALTPSDAFNIDQKIDDGAIVSGTFLGAGTGVIRAANGSNVTAGLPGGATTHCMSDIDAASTTTYRATTATAANFEGCVLAFQLD